MREVASHATRNPALERSEPVPHALAGTALYLAPEVLDGQAATVQSDIYSVGVRLFHLLTRTFPLSGPTLPAIRDAHRSGRRERLRVLRPDEVAEPSLGQSLSPAWSRDGRYLAYVSVEGLLRADRHSRALVIRDMVTGHARTLRPPLAFFINPR